MCRVLVAECRQGLVYLPQLYTAVRMQVPALRVSFEELAARQEALRAAVITSLEVYLGEPEGVIVILCDSMYQCGVL